MWGGEATGTAAVAAVSVKWSVLLVAGFLCLVVPDAKGALPTVHIPTTSGNLTLDGQASENAWAEAVVLKDFRVFEPRTDIPTRFRAEGKALRTKDALWLAFEVFVDPTKMHAPFGPRDAAPNGDFLAVQLDPGRSGRRAYSFLVTPVSRLGDAITNHENEQDGSWDSLYDARARILSDRWVAEVRIPFQSLRFENRSDTWGLQIYVISWEHQQGLSWTPVNRDVTNRLIQAAPVTGFQGAEPGRAIELLPSVTTAWHQSRENGTPACGWDAEYGQFKLCGVDLSYGAGFKWGITPSTTLDVVLNPDYSHIEADAPQLEINNRFPVHLAERRPFFQEAKDLFQLPFEVVYTRSINQPEVALKFTDITSNVRTGALLALDGSPPDSEVDERFSPSAMENGHDVSAITAIARAQVDINRRASVGILALDREYLDGAKQVAQNQVMGVDAAAELAPWLRSEAAFFLSHAESDIGDPVGWGIAGHARLVAQEENYRVQMLYQHIGDDFRSEAGFIPRRGFHHTFSKIDFYYRSEDWWARAISPGVWTKGWWNEDGAREERIIGVNTFWMFGPRLWFLPVYRRIGEVVDGRWLDGNRYTVHLGSHTLREFQLGFECEFGDTIIRDEALLDGEEPYLGWMVAPKVRFTIQPMAKLSWVGEYTHRLLYDRPGGEVLSDEPIIRSIVSYYFWRDLSLRYIAEWDGLDDHLNNDALLRYEPARGSVFFLRYREESLLGPLRLDSRSVFLKFAYLWST